MSTSPALLPSEVTAEMFAHLDHPDEHEWADDRRPALSSLALTLRPAADAAVDLLYSHIKLEVSGLESRDRRRVAMLNERCRIRFGPAGSCWAAAPLDGGDGGASIYAQLPSLAGLPTAPYGCADGSFWYLRELDVKLNHVGE
ncbi:hypothetical protein DL768_003089 [Monosporascus sp. mg162]|nr:hypothetical protein DL768_003089 [Monosporascus sp. mg162]